MIERKEVDFFSDYKSALQESIQTEKRSLEYVLIEESGPAHHKTFKSQVIIDGLVYVKPDKIYRGMSRADMLGEVARGLLAISNEFKIPVVGVVQSRRRKGDKKEGEDIDSVESKKYKFGEKMVHEGTKKIKTNNF